jgi:hypothetical protein
VKTLFGFGLIYTGSCRSTSALGLGEVACVDHDRSRNHKVCGVHVHACFEVWGLGFEVWGLRFRILDGFTHTHT